jgi:hypothetical protein
MNASMRKGVRMPLAKYKNKQPARKIITIIIKTLFFLMIPTTISPMPLL